MKSLGVFFLVLMISLNAYGNPKRVLIVINEGFQVDEYFVPKAIYEKNGFEVKTASRWGGLVHPGHKYLDTTPVQADLNFDQIKIADYDAITFTGGGGAWSDYFPAKNLHKVLADALKTPNYPVGLICAGVGLLATANNLDGNTPIAKGRHVTGYAEVSGLIRTQGQMNYDAGDLSKPYVVRDGDLVTGRDPSSAQLFGETIAKRLNDGK